MAYNFGNKMTSICSANFCSHMALWGLFNKKLDDIDIYRNSLKYYLIQ